MSWNMSKILLTSGSGMYGLGVDVDKSHQIDDFWIS